MTDLVDPKTGVALAITDCTENHVSLSFRLPDAKGPTRYAAAVAAGVGRIEPALYDKARLLGSPSK